MKLKLWPTGGSPHAKQVRILLASVVGVALLLVFFIGQEYNRVRSQVVNSWFEDNSADCGVVLTGGANRIREGIDLLAQKSIQKLIISGVHPRATLREIYPLLPFYGSINEQDIVLEKRSTTTYGNAQQTLPLVEALKCRDVVLITSQIHMYRAFKTFRGSFPIQIPILSRAVLAGRSEGGVDEVIWESFKSLFYSLWAY